MDVSTPPSRAHLLEHLPVAIVFTDRDGTVVDSTGRVQGLLGIERSMLAGTVLADFFAPEVRVALSGALALWVETDASPLAGRLLRLPLIDGLATERIGVRVQLSPVGFSVALLDLAVSGDGFRARLLDLASDADVGSAQVAESAAAVGEAFDWGMVTVWVVDGADRFLRAGAVWEADPGPGSDGLRGPGPGSQYRSATLAMAPRRGEALPGLAWERNEVVVVDDLAADPRFAGAAGARGALIPLCAGRRVVGVLELARHDGIDTSLWLASEEEALSAGIGQLVERFRERVRSDLAESRLALALEAGDLGVLMSELGLGPTEWSPRMAALHGVNATSGTTEELFASVVPADRARLDAALATATDTGDTQILEYQVQSAGELVVWVSTRITRVQVNGGPPVLWAASADVTDRKRADLRRDRRLAAVESLQWVSRAIIAGQQLDEIAVAVVDASTGVLGAEVGVLLYRAPGEAGSELAWAVSGLVGQVPDRPPPIDVVAISARSSRAEVVDDLGSDAVVLTLVESLGLGPSTTSGSAIVLPLLLDGPARQDRARGALVFVHSTPGFFSDADAQLAESIGSTTSVALDNANRHEEQRLAAVTFQRQLLPQVEIDVGEVDLCVRYHPGRDGLDVGGDWYDVIRIDDTTIGLAVGDVCGHGLAAAAHMGQFRFSFRALVQSSSTPEEAFRVINQMAIHELGTTVTIAYVEVDTATGDCTMWRCGHLPPVVASADGVHARWLDDPDAAGPMLGFLDQISVDPVRTVLAPGELLLLYTDGLVERRGESIEHGLERLAGSFIGRSPGLDDLCDELYDVLAIVGPDADDTVLLGLRLPV